MIISRTAEVKHSDYIFPRQRSDRELVELERSAVKESWLQIILNTLGLIFFLAAVVGLVMR